MRRLRRIALVTVVIALASYVIWGRVESAQLARDITGIERRGEPIDFASVQRPPATEEQRRAARLYAEAADRALERNKEEGYRLADLDVDRTVPPVVDLAELEATYRIDDPAIQLLDQATALDFAGFGAIAPELSVSQSPLATLGSLNDLRADMLAKRGHGDAAATALIASVRLRRTIMRPNDRYAYASRLLGSLRILLRHTSPGDESLVRLQRAFEQQPADDDLAMEVMMRRIDFLRGLDAPRATGDAILSVVFRPLIVYFARRQLSAFDDALAVARQAWPAKLDAAAALRAKYASEWKEVGRLRLLVEQGPPALGVLLLAPEAAGLDMAVRHTAMTVLAVERYRRAHAGAVPPTLAALVPSFMPAVLPDPFSGSPLIYSHDATSYIVYSVDVNRRDDGGILWGIGAMSQAAPTPRGPYGARDTGIRVPLVLPR